MNVIITFFTITSIIFGFVFGLFIADAIKGSNYSDVGISMYYYSKFAFVVGLLVFPLISGILLWLGSKTISKHSQIPSNLGIPGICLAYFLYIPLLRILLNT